MRRTCAKFGIRLLYAKPYSPESTGKIERYNQLIDGFLHEVALEKLKGLDKLNERFQVWMSECYQHKPHSALGDHTSPEAAFRGDPQTIRFAEPETLAHAFLHCETRKVDKAGCISFMGKKYEVGLTVIGCKVDVVYDPADISELTIEYEGYSPWIAHELTIGEYAGKRPEMPAHLEKQPADHSRLLEAAQGQYDARKEQRRHAISYRNVNQGGEA